MKDFNGTGLVVVIQGLQNGPQQVNFENNPKLLMVEAKIINSSGAVVYKTFSGSPVINFSGVTLPAGKNFLIISSGGEVKQFPLPQKR